MEKANNNYATETISEKTEEYFVNMGPQHPSTHGVLRLVLTIDGEVVKKVVPHIGYIHRSIEKMCEFDNYKQIVHLTDRMDYLSCHMNNEAVCLAVEKGANIEVPERAKVVRTILAELTRLSSHQLWYEGCISKCRTMMRNLIYAAVISVE